ncbi:hypothetical protein PTKIN_Ptkin17bG0050300 [Pterospermum kingtungense]
MREIVIEHLICIGFLPGYNNWYYHGESVPSRSNSSSFKVLSDDPIIEDDIEGLLQEAFNMGQYMQNSSPKSNDVDESNVLEVNEQSIGEATKFYKLLKDINEPLYEGSNYSKLSFCLRFFHLKCIHEMIGKVFDFFCEFLKDVFPFAVIPTFSYDCKKIIKDFSLGSHWVPTNSNEILNDDDGEVDVKKKPIKAKDGNLKHLADALAWKGFGLRYPNFASDSQNLRLGLASDGFNLFKVMSTSYSSWSLCLSYVRNKRYLKGSVAEGYLAEECMTFCSRYLEGVETRFDRLTRNVGPCGNELCDDYLSLSGGQPTCKVDVVELDDKPWGFFLILILNFIAFSEYKNILRSRVSHSRRSNPRELDKLFIETFHEWFASVWIQRTVSDEIKFLSQGELLRDEPYVFSSQVKQVFYSKEPNDKGDVQWVREDIDEYIFV